MTRIAVGLFGHDALGDEALEVLEGAHGGRTLHGPATARVDEPAAVGVHEGDDVVGVVRLEHERKLVVRERGAQPLDVLEALGIATDEGVVDVEDRALEADGKAEELATPREGLEVGALELPGAKGLFVREGADGIDQAPLHVARDAIMGRDEDVGTSAGGDRVLDLGAEGPEGDGEGVHLDVGMDTLERFDRGLQAGLLGAAVVVPQGDDALLLGACGCAGQGGTEDEHGERGDERTAKATTRRHGSPSARSVAGSNRCKADGGTSRARVEPGRSRSAWAASSRAMNGASPTRPWA